MGQLPRLTPSGSLSSHPDRELGQLWPEVTCVVASSLSSQITRQRRRSNDCWIKLSADLYALLCQHRASIQWETRETGAGVWAGSIVPKLSRIIDQEDANGPLGVPFVSCPHKNVKALEALGYPYYAGTA